MFKIFVCLLAMQAFYVPSNLSFIPATTECASVSNFHKTSETATTFSVAWDDGGPSSQYKLWWERQEDGSSSNAVTTSNLSLDFTGLTEGTYTFYIVKLCGTEESSWIGIEDFITG